MNLRLALPNRREHLTQKFKIAGQRLHALNLPALLSQELKKYQK
jgi:hypothetical protein